MPSENWNILKTKRNNISDCVLCLKYSATSARINVIQERNKNTEQYIQLDIKSNSNLIQKFWPSFDFLFSNFQTQRLNQQPDKTKREIWKAGHVQSQWTAPEKGARKIVRCRKRIKMLRLLFENLNKNVVCTHITASVNQSWLVDRAIAFASRIRMIQLK